MLKLTFWRFAIALVSSIVTLIVLVFLVKMSLYDIKFANSLPSKGIQDIPPPDTIIPDIFAQIPLSSLPIQSNKTNASIDMTLNHQITPEQCFGYAKTCRDVQCAFKEFNVICNKNSNGPICTCGASQVSSATLIQSNVHFVFLSIFGFALFLYIG